MTLSPGTKIGSYEILTLIGAGGMGEVYRAKDTRLNRDAAIKVLPERFASDSTAVASFAREAIGIAREGCEQDLQRGTVLEIVFGEYAQPTACYDDLFPFGDEKDLEIQADGLIAYTFTLAA